MELAWIVPVALIIAGTTYAVFARYFVHRERLARIQLIAKNSNDGSAS